MTENMGKCNTFPEDIEIFEIPLQAQDWKYLNEGADHIVVAYCGRKSNELLVCF